MKKAIVLLSGGQDSATCLAIAKKKFKNLIHTVAFDYGQRHVVELDMASKLAKVAGVSFEVIDLSFISKLSKNALTDDSLAISHGQNDLPNTFVPGRNLFFLATAGVIARREGAGTIYTGVCQTDFSGYPDCRADFIASMETTINQAMESSTVIKTPLMYLTKAETVKKMVALGCLDWYSFTHTCYEGVRPGCLKCPACILRKKGFDEAEFKDPLFYD